MYLKKTLFFLTIFSLIQLSYAQEVRVIDNKGTIQKINNITTSNTTPTNPVQGDVWFDTTNNLTKIYNGNIWLNLGGVNTNFNIVNVAGINYLRITDSGGSRDVALTDLSYSGTTGSIFFANTDGKPTENNSQLFWNNTNNRLGIGTATPTNKLEVTGAARVRGLLNSDGVATEPSYRFTDDSNTGFYSPAQDQLGLTVGGIEALNISELTNATKVTINETLELNGALLDINNDAGTAGQYLTSTNTGTDWVNLNDNFWSTTGNASTNPSTNFLGTTDATDFVVKTNNIEKLRVFGTKGQVLINNAPTFNNHPLVVRANGPDILAFQDQTGTPLWHWNIISNGLNFVESNVADYRLFLQQGGNVGVGTGAPSEVLDINGKARIRDIDLVTTQNLDVLVTTATGVIQKKTASILENTFTGKDDNLVADATDTSIYKDGTVGIGNFASSTIDASLHIKSTQVPFKIEPNTTTPTGASGGQMFVSQDDGLLYIYDGTRNKWLSSTRFTVGWGINSSNVTNAYLRQFNGSPSINNGWRMLRNGTITGISVQSENSDTWTLEIRKNDGSTSITTLAINNSEGNHNNTLNVNINEGDYLQAYVNGNGISRPQALIEIAWRK